VKHIDGTFPGASGGDHYWQAWLPDEPKAVVVLVHGVSEHGGRYGHVGKRLTDAGYAVYAEDHYGHGRSDGVKGDVGKFSWLVDDVDSMRRLAEERHPGLPMFVLGHSLGGLISLDYLTDRGEDGLKGLVVSGPAVDPSVGSSIERAVAPILARLLPQLALVDLGIDNISRDPEVVAAYRNDPLVYSGKVRARTGAESLAATRRVASRLSRLTLPLLVLHGGDDRLVSPNGGKLVYDSAQSRDKRHKVYDGLYHEIFNEPEQDAVIDDVLTWLDAHLV